MSSIKRSMKRQQSRRSSSSLASHDKKGKILNPPFLKLPNLKPVSWADDRLPEWLWAGLLIERMGRLSAIELLKHAVQYWIAKSDSLRPSDLTFTALSKIGSSERCEFLSFLCKNEDAKHALEPLLLLVSDLPGGQEWAQAIAGSPSQDMWSALGRTVINMLDHQSQTATDCRWLRLLYYTAKNQMQHEKNMAAALIFYPNVGDMRAVRPYIRATEMPLDFGQPIGYEWSKKFWRVCMDRTQCAPLDISNHDNEIDAKISSEQIQELLEALKKHWDNVVTDTDINPKRDAVFGIAFYCISILGELVDGGTKVGILGRSGLRTIVECYITLAFLVKRDQDDLWKEYRQYGSGQAKLSFLKLTEKVEKQPTAFNVDDLERLANEDFWQEFLPMNLGNWAKLNLRNMSEEAGIKEVYDSFYDWSSGFVHGHWGAVRDSVFVTCVNPLHRFHRIPEKRRDLNNVVHDAGELVNSVLGLLDKTYPSFSRRFVLK